MSKFYEVSDEGTLTRKNRFCPRCGPGYFMADMYNRDVCGNCGFTEFKKPNLKKTPKPDKEPEKKTKKSKETKPAKKRKKK